MLTRTGHGPMATPLAHGITPRRFPVPGPHLSGAEDYLAAR